MNWHELTIEILSARDEFIVDIEKWNYYPAHTLFMAKMLFYVEWLKTKDKKFKKLANMLAHCTFKPCFPNITNVAIFERWANNPESCRKLLQLEVPETVAPLFENRHKFESWLYVPNRVIRECRKHTRSRYRSYRNFLLVLAGYSYLTSCFHLLLNSSSINFEKSINLLFGVSSEAKVLHDFRKIRNAIIHAETYDNPEFNIGSLLEECANKFNLCYENKIIQGEIIKLLPDMGARSFGKSLDLKTNLTNLSYSGSSSFF